MESHPTSEQEALIEELAFTFPTWFFEILCELDDKPLVLEDFQLEYLMDDSLFKITNKTRQSGGSMQVALAKMFKAYRTHAYRCDIVSINLAEATDKIKYVRNFWESMPMKYRIPLTTDNALSIGFHKGRHQSIIHSRAASAGVRGGRKDVVFDEFAHIEKATDLYRSAAPAAINGNLGVDLVSTPMGDKNLFAEIWLNREDEFGERPYDMFSRHEFIWCDVRRFVTDYDECQRVWKEEMRKDMNQMRELVRAFGTDKLKMFYRQYPWEYFKQEFCGVFLDETTAFFPWSLIEKCLRGEVGEASDGKMVYKEEAMETWTKRPLGNTNEVFVGVDFGESDETTDKTSIQILERDSADGKLKHRYSEVLSKDKYPDFPTQAQHIADVCAAFGANKISCDETGLGRGIVPLIKKLLPDKSIEGVNFNYVTKEEMVMNLKTLMEQENIWLQAKDKMLHGQIRNIQRDLTATGRANYHGEPHDDMFWALALAARGGAYKPFSIYTIGGRSSRF